MSAPGPVRPSQLRVGGRDAAAKTERLTLAHTTTMELLNDLRRCAEEVAKSFTDHGDHYEYTGSMNAVEDLRSAVGKAREHWLEKMR